MPGVWSPTFSGRPAAPSATGACGISLFRRKEFPRMHRVSDRAGSMYGLPMAPSKMLPSASLNGVGTPDFIISRLDGWPACAPVNASPVASRPAQQALVPVQIVNDPADDAGRLEVRWPGGVVLRVQGCDAQGEPDDRIGKLKFLRRCCVRWTARCSLLRAGGRDGLFADLHLANPTRVVFRQSCPLQRCNFMCFLLLPPSSA